MRDNNNDNNNKSKVIEVFIDVEAHRFTADIIKRHSTNQNDIREIALEGLDLQWCRNILELGCGFGFFTEALKGKVHPEAVVTGVDIIRDYEPLFLEVCERIGVGGNFLSSEAASIVKDFEDETFDLVICSYSLYFFPEIVPDISRVLNGNGLLIATVHNQQNMGELVRFAKSVLGGNRKLKQDEKLPIQVLISKFSSENGYEILSSWFQNVRSVDYTNTLIFEPGDMDLLMEYLRFKCPFLLAATPDNMEITFDLLKIHLQKYFSRTKSSFTISKDDTIFVCSGPSHERGIQ